MDSLAKLKKKKFFFSFCPLQIWPLKTCNKGNSKTITAGSNKGNSKTITAGSLKLGQLREDDE